MGRIQSLSQYEHPSGRRINLVTAAEGEASIAPLCTAYSTATLGYITADAVHHIFPLLTSNNKALRLHTGSMCRIPQDAIVSPTSENIPRLHHACEDRDLNSFDVRFNTLPHNSIAPCGLTCPLRMHSFDGMQAFRLVSDGDSPSLPAAEGINPNLGFKGPNVFFALGSKCANPACPNFGVRRLVIDSCSLLSPFLSVLPAGLSFSFLVLCIVFCFFLL